MKETTKKWDKEAIYDEQIAPLMAQIIDICKHNDMPMFATFAYGRDDEEDHFCSTLLNPESHYIPALRKAFTIVRDGESRIMAMTIQNQDT